MATCTRGMRMLRATHQLAHSRLMKLSLTLVLFSLAARTCKPSCQGPDWMRHFWVSRGIGAFPQGGISLDHAMRIANCVAQPITPTLGQPRNNCRAGECGFLFGRGRFKLCFLLYSMPGRGGPGKSEDAKRGPALHAGAPNPEAWDGGAPLCAPAAVQDAIGLYTADMESILGFSRVQ